MNKCKNCARQYFCNKENMKIPKTFIKNNKKYYYIERYKNFARYQTGDGISECFNFHELGLIEETIRERQAKNGGVIKV